MKTSSIIAVSIGTSWLNARGSSCRSERGVGPMGRTFRDLVLFRGVSYVEQSGRTVESDSNTVIAHFRLGPEKMSAGQNVDVVREEPLSKQLARERYRQLDPFDRAQRG